MKRERPVRVRYPQALYSVPDDATVQDVQAENRKREGNGEQRNACPFITVGGGENLFLDAQCRSSVIRVLFSPLLRQTPGRTFEGQKGKEVRHGVGCEQNRLLNAPKQTQPIPDVPFTFTRIAKTQRKRRKRRFCRLPARNAGNSVARCLNRKDVPRLPASPRGADSGFAGAGAACSEAAARAPRRARRQHGRIRRSR